MTVIDAHIHYGDKHPALRELLDELDIKLLNICVAHDEMGNWRAQAERYCSLAQQYPTRFAWCTSFDLPRFDDPNYVRSVKRQLDHDFANGAVACKVWKNIGMEVKIPSNGFILPDDPLLDPIYAHIQQAGKPLLTHIAEPLACWQPLNHDNPHYGYYSRNPQWHMFDKPEYPSHAQLMEARDHVLEKHPTLRVIGAHIGSLEYDVDVAAQRLTRYPNFAMDVSARLADLAIQDSDKVRDFFLRFPDRIIFGTDVVMRHDLSQMNAKTRKQTLDNLRLTYRTYFDYFETDQIVDVRGFKTRGLGLPAAILDQFYRGNALHWYPDL